MDIELLHQRAAFLRTIRQFFDERSYLEVDTPSLSCDLIPESSLEVFSTEYRPPYASVRQSQPLYLIPSPEIYMKKLLAAHRQSLYQICHCFRNGESTGRWHSPEFSMLEYYTVGGDALSSIALTEKLLQALLPKDAPQDLKPPFYRMTVAEAFEKYAGFPLFETAQKGPAFFATRARQAGVQTADPDFSLADLFNLVFVHMVEPNLPQEQPLILCDYPAFVPTTAKLRGNVYERWELYIRGIEIANCYSEETDLQTLQSYFNGEIEAKKAGALVQHAVDPEYPKIIANMPPCSGVALGLDRLFMCLSGRSSIDAVLAFSLNYKF